MLPIPKGYSHQDMLKILETTSLRDIYADMGTSLIRSWKQINQFLRPSLDDDLHGLVPQSLMGVTALANFCSKPSTGDEAEDSILAEFSHWTACWAQMGFPTFNLAGSVLTALLLTDSHKLLVDDAPWPFDSFAVILPSPIEFLGPDNQTVLEGRLLVVHRYLSPRDEKDSEAMNTAFEDAFQAAKIRRYESTVVTVDFSPKSVPLEWKTVVRLVSPKGVSIFQNDHLPTMGSDETLARWLYCEQNKEKLNLLEEKDKTATQIMARVVANLSFYLASLKDHNHYPKHKMCKRSSGEHTFYDVPLQDSEGRVIKLQKELREAAHAFVAQGRRPQGWELHSRISVRGHFKMQPHGPRMSLRKRIFVPPHRRGPESRDIAPSLYMMEDPKTD